MNTTRLAITSLCALLVLVGSISRSVADPTPAAASKPVVAAAPAVATPAPTTTVNPTKPAASSLPAKPTTTPTGGVARSAPAIPPWDHFLTDKHTRIMLDFRNASIDSVLRLLTDASGIPIIKDPALQTTLTVECSRPVSLDDAFALVNAALGLHSIELAKGTGKWLVARTIPGSAPVPGPPTAPAPHPVVAPPTPPATPTPAANDENDPILTTYKIKYASAIELARVINEAFTALGPPQQNPFQPPQPGQPLTPKLATVRASAEDYSNTLLVNAPKKQQAQIVALIATVDVSSDTPHKSRVFHLIYARASDVEPVVENILDGSASLGRGGSTSSQSSRRNNNNPFMFYFGQQQQNQNTNGTVVSNDRTNSLIVTTTDEDLSQIADVIADLDKPAIYQSTTFVYRLKNARADVVANLLNQSFGNHESNGPVGGSLTGTGPKQSLATATTGNGNTGTNGQPPGLNNINNNQQNNGNNYNNNGNQNGGNGSNPLPNLGNETSSLDDEGHVVNVKNLIGAVLLVPNIDTNSIICVCEPEDRKVLDDILDQMDEIPEQVMIETLVVEATLDKTDQFGVEWNYSGYNPFGLKAVTTGSQSYGLQGNTTQPQGLHVTLTAPQYSAFIQAVQTDTKFNVLSTPRIFTTNNATAQINISQSLPYVTNQTVDTTGTILYNYNFLDVGIVLTVTPRVTSGGYVTMDVSQTANDFQGYTSFNAPIVNQREAETTVSVADGETVVLGGIINDSVNTTISKVPIVGDIPLVGQLFRSTNKTKQKTELLVFLTPHVVRNSDDARRLRADTEATMGNTTKSMIPSAPHITPPPHAPTVTPPSTLQLPATATPPPVPPATVTTTVLPS